MVLWSGLSLFIMYSYSMIFYVCVALSGITQRGSFAQMIGRSRRPDRKWLTATASRPLTQLCKVWRIIVKDTWKQERLPKSGVWNIALVESFRLRIICFLTDQMVSCQIKYIVMTILHLSYEQISVLNLALRRFGQVLYLRSGSGASIPVLPCNWNTPGSVLINFFCFFVFLQILFSRSCFFIPAYSSIF